MIKLNVEHYCSECSEFEPDVNKECYQLYSPEPYGNYTGEHCNTTVTCKHAQRCECIREFIKRNDKGESE